MTNPVDLIQALDHALLLALTPHVQRQTPLPVRLALSGGLDSVLLLHRLQYCRLPIALEAVHVHHGLQDAAADFAQFCQQLCRSWQIAYRLERVTVADPSRNIEAQARQARYQALASNFTDGSLLLTAHHADDQIETLLLALKRGAGLAGLASIAAEKAFHNGWLLRPWLSFSRAELTQAATHLHLRWVEDPTNFDVSLDRNFLRQQVLPLLTQRFPQFSKTAARSVAHLQQAYLRESTAVVQQLATLHDAVSLQHWQRLGVQFVETPLRLTALTQLAVTEQLLLLKHWLADYAPLLEMTQLHEILRQLTVSQVDANPQVQVGSAVLRRYDQWLVLCAEETSEVIKPVVEAISQPQLRQGCVYAGFSLQLTDKPPQAPWFGFPCPDAPTYWLTTGILNRRLTVAGRGLSKALKDLCKERRIPSWLRQRLPVLSLTADGQSVCWMLGVGSSVDETTGLWLCWQPTH